MFREGFVIDLPQLREALDKRTEATRAAILAWTARGGALLPVWWPEWSADGVVRCACGSAHHDTQGTIGKHPIGTLAPNGFRNASRDPKTVLAWLQRYPRMNLGLRPDSVGLVVLDVDKPEQEHVARTLGVFTQPTFTQRTGSGWWHFGFQHPAPERDTPVDGIIVRGGNGFIVIAPSLHHSGNAYEQIHGPEDAQPMPNAFAERLRAATSLQGGRARVHAALTTQRITAGGRHDALKAVAAHLIGKGIGAEYAEQLVQAYNATYCDPPKPPAEVADIVAWTIAREREKHATLARPLLEQQPRKEKHASGFRTVFRSQFTRRSA